VGLIIFCPFQGKRSQAFGKKNEKYIFVFKRLLLIHYHPIDFKFIKKNSGNFTLPLLYQSTGKPGS